MFQIVKPSENVLTLGVSRPILLLKTFPEATTYEAFPFLRQLDCHSKVGVKGGVRRVDSFCQPITVFTGVTGVTSSRKGDMQGGEIDIVSHLKILSWRISLNRSILAKTSYS